MVVCITLCSQVSSCIASAGWMSSCTPTWVSTPNTHASGGVEVGAENSLSDCQTACLNITNCSGLDWNPGNTAGERCWLHGPWSGPRFVASRHGITHFNIKYNCSGENINFRLCVAFADFSCTNLRCSRSSSHILFPSQNQ